MEQDAGRLYDALTARDRRFDGVFFVGVTSTRIYCRPICPVRTPRQANCRFFASPQESEQAGFRPCLRCRPELAPGSAPVDDAQRIARLIVERLEERQLDDVSGLEEVAGQFELSSRQIRRIVQKELGVPPIQLLLTRRLLLAKQLLTDTALPVTDIAFASGFASVRRFNDAFGRRYRMAPTRLRRAAAEAAPSLVDGASFPLFLSYRPPYDWAGVSSFLARRALAGVEWVTADAYARTVRLGQVRGWIRVTHSPKRHALRVEVSHSLAPVLPTLLSRVRALFDLDARPDLITAHLAKDRRLAPVVRRNPGMRVPGAFDGFELGMRAILGQQISVNAAATICGRLVEALGEPMATPFPELRCLAPAPARVAAAGVDGIARAGIVAMRARALVALAEAQASSRLSLDGGARQSAGEIIAMLGELPGIGPGTAQYIAMRALRWPDAFPSGDVVVRHRLGDVTPRAAESLSHPWRPWRSYVVMHLWRMGAAPEAAARARGARNAPAREERTSR